MAWRAGRSRQPPQSNSGYDDYDDYDHGRPDHPPAGTFARPGGGGRGTAAGARHPPAGPPRGRGGHAPTESDHELPPPPAGGRAGRLRDRNNIRNNYDYVDVPAAAAGTSSTGGQGRGRGTTSTARWAPWKPPSQVSSTTDDVDSSSSSSSSDDDEPEFRDMDITIDNNRIMNANGAKIVSGLRVKRDLKVRIRNNRIGS